MNIIQGIDRKLDLEDIASDNDLSMDDLYDEMVAIVHSGTKVDIDYYIEDEVDEYSVEDIYEYFMHAETDDVDTAYHSLREEDDELTVEDLVTTVF